MAQHTRLFAVALGNDDPKNSMAGSSMGGGLWQSDDLGKTWEQLGWKHIKAFSMDCTDNGKTLYLAAGNGILKSTDSGTSWKVMTDWRVAEVLDVLVLKDQTSLVFGATAHGLIRSADSGKSWAEVRLPTKTKFISRLYETKAGILACTEEGELLSRDKGLTWAMQSGTGQACRAVAWSPVQSYHASDEGAMVIMNDGNSAELDKNSWWDVNYNDVRGEAFFAGRSGVIEVSVREGIMSTPKGPVNAHAVMSVGEMVFAGSLGEGVWVQHDGNASWEPSGLAKSQVWRLKAFEIK